ncbi:low molecular weight protein tyrosine phosphatase family protein [Sphingomonas sp. MMS24-J45]|uniref:low molecular weight protein tyrosine phosphatase family protein n=1 Tax=Sphingomonas sp. MMS24-J45 TaxID=3238806 RepID=UPI00384F2C2E
MKNILFVCSQNRLRSPTAEQIFSSRTDIAVSSAGTNHDAENPIGEELIEWADFIFVMERTHRNRLQKRFRAAIKDKRIVCLEIPDDYEFMDPGLVRLLQTKMARYLPSQPLDEGFSRSDTQSA